MTSTTTRSSKSDFSRLWAAQAISEFGARISREGRPIMAVLGLGGGPAALGLLAALSRGSPLLIGLTAGGFVDRSRRRPVLIAMDLFRAAALLSLPLAAVWHVLAVAQVCIVAVWSARRAPCSTSPPPSPCQRGAGPGDWAARHLADRHRRPDAGTVFRHDFAAVARAEPPDGSASALAKAFTFTPDLPKAKSSWLTKI